MENLFAKRFTELLKTCPYSYEELAKKLDLKSKGTISKYAKGDIKNVSMSMIVKISELFGVSPIWLIGLTEDPNYIIADTNEIVRIPIITNFIFGKRVEKQIDPKNYILASKNFTKSNQYFAYKMSDDSMNPFLMKDDILLIKEQEEVENGQTVLAIIPDSTVVIRTILQTETGIILKPMNSSFDPIAYTHKEVKESKLKLLGVIKKVERNKYFI